MSGKRFVDCPACRRRTVFGPENPWRPFCSERCRTGDLGAWASDAYVIQGNPTEDEASSDTPAPPAAPKLRN